MMEKDYYPEGAYTDPDAPWNEPYIPEKDFNVCVSQTLSKSAQVSTDKYQPYIDEEDGHEYIETSNIDWTEVYERQHYTPEKIIGICRDLAEHLVERGETRFKDVYLKSLIGDCKEWTVDETTVIEE